jgi:apolipoprotein N-acyltransferase
MSQIRIGRRVIRLPASRVARTAIGLVFIILGIFGFLPILGFWMIPVGLIILSVDFPAVRRLRRQWAVRGGAWLKRRAPRVAAGLGFTVRNDV